MIRKEVNTYLKKWLEAAKADEVHELARLAGTSVQSLYHISNGVRLASSDRAARIELAARRLRDSRPVLPPLDRGMLNETCRECAYFRFCKKNIEEEDKT